MAGSVWRRGGGEGRVQLKLEGRGNLINDRSGSLRLVVSRTEGDSSCDQCDFGEEGSSDDSKILDKMSRRGCNHSLSVLPKVWCQMGFYRVQKPT